MCRSDGVIAPSVTMVLRMAFRCRTHHRGKRTHKACVCRVHPLPASIPHEMPQPAQYPIGYCYTGRIAKLTDARTTGRATKRHGSCMGQRNQGARSRLELVELLRSLAPLEEVPAGITRRQRVTITR